MQTFPDKNYPATVIVRHRRENLRKCSLKGLENREDLLFFTYPVQDVPHLDNYVLLDLNAPELSCKEADCGLLVLDATWRYAERMRRQVTKGNSFIRRSVPREWRTAYPRKQNDCPDPDVGLASVEAIWAAYCVLGRKMDGLLDGYYWKDEFLSRNRHLYRNTFKIWDFGFEKAPGLADR